MPLSSSIQYAYGLTGWKVKCLGPLPGTVLTNKLSVVKRGSEIVESNLNTRILSAPKSGKKMKSFEGEKTVEWMCAFSCRILLTLLSTNWITWACGFKLPSSLIGKTETVPPV